MSLPLPSLSVFFPAYNDALSIPGLIQKAFAVLAASAREFEVIVVNDGSQDETAGVLPQLAARYGPCLRIVEHPTCMASSKLLSVVELISVISSVSMRRRRNQLATSKTPAPSGIANPSW